MKTALIYGITGMDGSHLADFLLSKDYEVHGIMRRNSTFNTSRIDHLINSPIKDKKFFLHHGDISDSSNTNRLIAEIKPDELYELAANSHVKVSFEIPEYTADIDALGILRVIEAVRIHSPKTKVYFACTSECFGGLKHNIPSTGYNEDVPFYPRSPYGVAKQYGYWICKNYREAYDLFISNGILFNHSSYRRGETFLTRKVTRWLGKKDKDKTLRLGNIYSYRDEGHSYDYVKAMWMMLQHNIPEDFVIATSKAYSIKNWVEYCFKERGYELYWEGQGLDEKGYVDGKLMVEIDKRYFRPTEVDHLLGDNSKAKSILGWEPTFSYEDIAKEMVKYDCDNIIPDYIHNSI